MIESEPGWRVKVGIIVPQGWTGEYDGWDASRAWARSVAIAHEAEALGFDSLWLFDHVQTEPVPRRTRSRSRRSPWGCRRSPS